LTISTENASVSGVTAGKIERGVEYTATFTANSGYEITSVIINGYVNGPMDSYTFTGDSDVSIQVIAKKLYTLTWGNPTGATIEVWANGAQISSGAQLAEGTSFAVTVHAASGYYIESIKIGSETVTNPGSAFTLERVISADTVITVTAAKTEEQKKTEILTALTNDPSKYFGNTLKVENGKIVSNGKQATVKLTADFFELLKSYGYTKINFTLNKTSGQTNTSRYYYQVTGSASISSSKGATSQSVATSASAAVEYKAQYRTSNYSSWRDDSSTWELTNISFS
jgi:hypothetical protein